MKDAIELGAFLDEPSLPSRFVIDPYVPFEGITLLHGKTKIGKSPLTWEMARSVASGEPFLGKYPVTKGHVLYCDMDTSPQLVRERLRLLPSIPRGFYLSFPGVRNILEQPTQAYFRRLAEEIQPIFVIFNTLRKLYQGDEKDSGLPSKIYQTLLALFYPAGVLLVHHDRKTQMIPKGFSGPPHDEAFSGTMAWLNDCQVGLHLMSAGLKNRPGALRMIHRSQVSREEPATVILLAEDGTNIGAYKSEIAVAVTRAYYELPQEMSKTERVTLVAKRLNMSERSAWTYLSGIGETEPKLND